MNVYRVHLLPDNITLTAAPQTRLVDIIRDVVSVNFPCGGEGRCGKCVVRVVSPPPPTEPEIKLLSPASLSSGLRLLCRLVVSSDMEIEIPLSSRITGTVRAPESISIIRDETGNDGGIRLSVDVGTTNVAAALVSVDTKKILDHASTLNPQISFGADVISRITAVMKSPEALKKQQNLVIGAINGLVELMCSRLRIKPGDISEAAAAGNPTMEHLLLGIDPASIARAPFSPGFFAAQKVAAGALGLCISPESVIYIFPVLSGYVGGDTLSFIWSSRIHESEKMTLGIDIGTNGEIVLGDRKRLISCSAAAGPAFEGSHIRNGMRAEDGAIDGVSITGDRLAISVKGNGTPRGICGSGIFDAISELLSSRLIDENGRLASSHDDTPLTQRIENNAGVREFLLYRDEAQPVGITQKDVREVQLAKSAIHSGVEILMMELGIRWDDIESILIAGSFGNYLKRKSITGVGLIPKALESRITFVGDAALSGAIEAVLDPGAKHGIEKLAHEIQYVELSTDKRFNDLFIKNLPFREV